MYCTQCGANNPDEARFCFSCGSAMYVTAAAPVPPVTPVSMPPSPPAPPAAPVVEYAGFWRRWLALVIDWMILGIPCGIIFLLFILPAINAAIQTDDADRIATMVASYMVGWVLMGGLLLALIPLIYYSAFESSQYQATLGKMALGIIVTDMHGQRISFARSLGRNAGKFISKMIMHIGFIMAGFTEKKQALHDILADCLVVMKYPTR